MPTFFAGRDGSLPGSVDDALVVSSMNERTASAKADPTTRVRGAGAGRCGVAALKVEAKELLALAEKRAASASSPNQAPRKSQTNRGLSSLARIDIAASSFSSAGRSVIPRPRDDVNAVGGPPGRVFAREMSDQRAPRLPGKCVRNRAYSTGLQ